MRKEDWRMQLSYLYLHTASFVEYSRQGYESTLPTIFVPFSVLRYGVQGRAFVL